MSNDSGTENEARGRRNAVYGDDYVPLGDCIARGFEVDRNGSHEYLLRHTESGGHRHVCGGNTLGRGMR